MQYFDKTAVVIPVFNPEPGLQSLCRSLVSSFRIVIVVDDGSKENCSAFKSLPESILVIRHACNKGKGAAIKTALRYLSENTEAEYAVFADGDGQHLPKDIVAVANRANCSGNTVLGVRRFKLGQVPLRSWVGNVCTALIVRLLMGIRVSDTQTGLRAISRRLFDELAAEPGDRYEFEVRLFRFLKERQEKLEQVEIDTVYIDSNRASHFRPVMDSIRIYRNLIGSMFLKFCGSSILGFLIDNLIFTCCILLLGASGYSRKYMIFVSLVIARIVSATCNYYCNRRLVFKSKGRLLVSYSRYWGLVCLIAILSYCGTTLISAVSNSEGWHITCVKVFVETILFLLSYRLQKIWVFQTTAKKDGAWPICPIQFNAPELAFVGMMVFACVANLIFFTGGTLSGLPFLIGTVFVSVLAVARSFKTMLGLLSIYVIGVLLAFAATSYTATDAMRAYFPLQRILAEGWNPIYGLDQASICNFTQTSACGTWFIQYVPNLSPLMAAIVDKAFGLFCGDAFCGVVMMSILMSSAFRFGNAIWHSRFAGMVLALGVAITPKTTSFLAGHVDYTVYSMMVLAILSTGLWVTLLQPRDLILAVLACVGAMASKATGVPFAILFLLFIMAWHFKGTAIWKVLLGASVLICLLCYSPYFVNIFTTGSAMPNRDLTVDFTGKSDAMQMGRFLRMVFAWVSPTLAKAMGSFVYHSGFNPVFALNVSGYGTLYRLLLLISVMGLIFSSKNAVWIVCVLLFVSGNLLPTRYIGFSRYCPQLYILPMLAILNFVFVPSHRFCAAKRVFTVVKIGAGGGIVLLVAFLFVRSIAYFEAGLAWHSARIHEIEKMKAISRMWRLPGNHIVTCTAMKFLEYHGLKVVDDPNAPIASFDTQYLMMSSEPIDEGVLAGFAVKFGICDSPRALLHFNWLDALRKPHL